VNVPHETASTASRNGRRLFPLPLVDGPLSPMVTITTQRLGDAAVVDVLGEIDMLTAPAMRRALEDLIGELPRVVVVRLAGVSFMGSSGLGALVAVQDAAICAGVPLRLACPSKVARRALEVIGLTRLFDVHEHLRTALVTD
jgi:anti-sigma B factor antagonist